jgi:hypothetical protein
VIRRSTGMPFFDAQADFRSAHRAHGVARAGLARLEVVPIARIVGTLEPSGEFDARFRPALEVTRHRGQWIALAHRTVVPLPPVVLHEGPHGCYVIDGRDRVSVARALGQTDIHAWVTGGGSRGPGGAHAVAAA